MLTGAECNVRCLLPRVIRPRLVSRFLLFLSESSVAGWRADLSYPHPLPCLWDAGRPHRQADTVRRPGRKLVETAEEVGDHDETVEGVPHTPQFPQTRTG